MPDVEFKWMQGGGEARPWLCPIYGPSAELEILDLLFSLVRLVRPKLIVETGCHRGIGTFALGRAAREVNARVISCDIDPALIVVAENRCCGLPVEIRLCRAEDLSEVERADFLFLDGSEDSRIECVPRMKSGALALMHDTRQEPFLRDAFKGLGSAVHLESWRGATLFSRIRD